MSTIKRTILAGLAAVTMISAGAVIAPSQAEAKHKYGSYYGGYNYYGGYKKVHNYGYKNYYKPNCYWKKVWKKTHRWHHHKHKVSIKICY
ncbi:MAG: hypothetical protein L3J32_06365 [Rhizobiaceae bacterium]|nr:hypothetical protein [Rhizobiaceae bacterium]